MLCFKLGGVRLTITRLRSRRRRTLNPRAQMSVLRRQSFRATVPGATRQRQGALDWNVLRPSDAPIRKGKWNETPLGPFQTWICRYCFSVRCGAALARCGSGIAVLQQSAGILARPVRIKVLRRSDRSSPTCQIAFDREPFSRPILPLVLIAPGRAGASIRMRMLADAVTDGGKSGA